jgi:hypothetical protein
MEKKLKHLEMIQSVINRLANNSFSLKLKSFIFVAVILGFTTKDSDLYYIPLTFIPTLAFWGLDGFYLKREQLFRALYDNVRQKDDKDIDFSMDVSTVKLNGKSWISICISWTILGFHLPILLVIIIRGTLVLVQQ